MRRFSIYLLRFIGAILFTFVITLFPFWKLESYIYDLRVKLSPKSAPHSQIVLIGIDDQSIRDLGGKWPIPSTKHVDVLKKLQGASPLAIAFMFPLHQQEWSKGELEKLSAATANAKNTFHSVKLLPAGGDYPAKELPGIKPKLSFTLVDSQHFAKDKVARRGALWFLNDRFLEYELANIYHGKGQDLASDKRFMNKTQNVDGGQTFLTNYIGPKGTFPIISYNDVLNKDLDPKWFRNKIILIGPTYWNESENIAYTPHSKSFSSMTRLEIQANVLQTLLNKNPIVTSPPWLNTSLTFLVAAITIFILFSFTPLAGIAFLALEIAILLLLGYISFVFFRFWLILIHPLLTVFTCYYLCLPYRLIVEDRRRWKYQKRSEILGQVEQLKTNFMSLISHDLKTPIAKIQGMAERALNSPDPEEKKESLNSILRSSEKLSSFVSNILDLTRIETNKVALQKSSKDLNNTIEEVILSLNYLAREKKIEIVKELEPLFSIKFDAHLIKQSLTNLIENALKYSPENGRIIIRSAEMGDLVKVSVIDSGPGLSDFDKENVFSRFYRGKNNQNVSIKGTGLGLYLVKYFIELHGGSVAVESSPGKGSMFWFTLPV